MTVPSATPRNVQPLSVDDPSLYRNRELSWLAFNQRVLEQALEDYHPLLERVKFLAIVASNLDEFFMVRVATLLKKQRAGVEHLSIDGLTVALQLAAIRQRAATMMRDVTVCWKDRLRPALEEYGIRFLEPDDYTDKTKRYLASYFRAEIFPLLTPLAFDPGHPFPVISNRSKNVAVVVRQGRLHKFARVKIPPLLPRFIPIAGASSSPGLSGMTFAFLEDVIRGNIGELFPGMEIVSAHLFRVIRDTDMEVPDDAADDLLESVDRTLRELRHAPPSLLQIEASMPSRVINTLVDNFGVEDDIVVRTAERFDFADWMALHKLPYAHLKDAPFTPRALWDPQRSPGVFDDIRDQDYMVHHPFDSFGAVEVFLRQASTDPHVVGIKMTLYRVGENSPLVDLLIDAADAGKQVAVLVELKARFDERANIGWATRLEDAGVHVVYGVPGLKTHCKLCLVVRKEADGVRRYAHVGTGNYNRATSQVYTDFGLFTADPGVLDDVVEVFNYLTGYSRQTEYGELLVAPVNLRERFGKLIAREVANAEHGRRAHIIIKNNAVTDPGIARALYLAAQAGVEIDMIVRGACALRPGIPGISDRIRLRSVVGRFLEHSRVYYFENGGDSELYFGSADLMERNLDRRVETLCRVRDGSIARHIRQVVLDAYLRDTDRAYVLVDDTYRRAAPVVGSSSLSAQQFLLDWYGANPSGGDDGRPLI